MRSINFPKLIIAIVISELVGVIGSFFTAWAIPSWYTELIKPVINPPGWLFRSRLDGALSLDGHCGIYRMDEWLGE